MQATLSYLMSIFAFLIIAFILRWSYLYFKYRAYLKGFRMFTKPFLRDCFELHNQMLSSTRALGKNFWTMLGLFPVLCTSDPKLFSCILGSAKYVDKGPLYNSFKYRFGRMLLTEGGETWRTLKHLIKPTFSYSLLIDYLNIFNCHGDKIIKTLGYEIQETSSNILEIIETTVLDVTCECVLGTVIDENCPQLLKSLNFCATFSVPSILRVNAFFNLVYKFTRDCWKERKNKKCIKEYLKSTIKERRLRKIGVNDSHEKSIFIDILLKEMETNKAVTEEFVISHLFAMLLGGFGNTSHSISYTLYALAKNPIIQQNAHEEVFSILGDDVNQPITCQQIATMKYLDNVIKESLRMYTVGAIYARQLLEDVAFEGVTLPKGLSVMFLPFVMHQDPELYPEPEKFVPERFLPENLNSTPYAYAPFCLGFRQCMGKKFAEMVMKVILAKILLHYEVVDVQHELHLGVQIALTSKTGIKVGIRRRENKNSLMEAKY